MRPWAVVTDEEVVEEAGGGPKETGGPFACRFEVGWDELYRSSTGSASSDGTSSVGVLGASSVSAGEVGDNLFSPSATSSVTSTVGDDLRRNLRRERVVLKGEEVLSTARRPVQQRGK